MKNEFRKKAIAIREKQDYFNQYQNSILITERLLSIDCIKKADTIMLYLDFNNEVKTDKLVQNLISMGKRVVSPISVKETRELLPYEIKDLNSNIKISDYGIREPDPQTSQYIDPKEIDVVIVPAIAFDKNGFRLGYGAGFYDRFLITLRDDAITVGVAFELQVFDEIPIEDHDVKLDYIITENRTINPK